LYPEYLLALYGKGNSLRKLGRDEEAEQCLAKARELQQC
jgi:Flp pilus assembly protein TadD